MIRSPTQPVILNTDKPIKQQHYLAKSSLMSQIIHGANTQQNNNHFIDSLERFKKDYATFDKQQRQKERQKRLRVLEERKNQQVQRESRMRRNQLEYDQKNMEKINQSRYLCELGLKKTGFSNGLPMNPITLQYHQNPFGSQQKFNDQEVKLRRLVRAHHIQNASTCGYNVLNGQGLPTLDPLIPKNSEERLDQKIGQFYQTKRLNPNVDLRLNPKNVLPKYVGEPERQNNPNSSPIKNHKWDEQEVEFQSSYQSHFNEKPHEIMTNSRMQQSNLIRQYLIPNFTKGGPVYNEVQSQVRQPTMRQNNQNVNPYMQDTAFQSQMYDMRR